MADRTPIEWTDATWNIVTGCAIVSPGCTNCYAMRLAGTRLAQSPSRAGLTKPSKAGPVWTGAVRFNEQWLSQPLTWRRPRRIFVCAHGDLFAEGVEEAWLDQIFAVMALAKQHTFQVLTKRPERMRAYLTDAVDLFDGRPLDYADRFGVAAAQVTGSPCAAGAVEDCQWPLPNVWLGVSVEDQARADQRLPILNDTPAALRWVSAEPLLGPLDLMPYLDGLDWIVAGGESGPAARPMHPEWVRALRDDCAFLGLPFLFKQWGEWAPGTNVTRTRGRVAVADRINDTWHFGEENLARTDGHVDDEPDLYRIGKAEAGRRLDGEVHDGFPGGAS